MIALFTLLSMIVSPCHEGRIQIAYENQDVSSLKSILQNAESQSIKLLATYRLYPLTKDPDLIADIPTSLPDDANARDLALLAALWSFRIEEDRTLLISAGLRMDSLLKRAKNRDASDPFYILVEAQGFLYKPRIFGGNKNRALEMFKRLAEQLETNESCGINAFDARVWTWYALEKTGHQDADSYRRATLDRKPPLVYRQFFMSPP